MLPSMGALTPQAPWVCPVCSPCLELLKGVVLLKGLLQVGRRNEKDGEEEEDGDPLSGELCCVVMCAVCRGSLRLREPVWARLWHRIYSVEQRAFQQRCQVWSLLCHHVLPLQALLPRHSQSDGHGHQLLSSQRCLAQQQRRLVQPSLAAFRLGAACVLAHCRLESWHHPGSLQKVRPSLLLQSFVYDLNEAHSSSSLCCCS